QLAYTVNVKSMFGAVGDDTHDDAPNLNAAADFVRALITASGRKGIKIVLPYGVVLVNSAVNWTGIQVYPLQKSVVIDGGGAMIHCNLAGTAGALAGLVGTTAP